MRRIGYWCAGLLFVLFLALSVNAVRTEPHERSPAVVKAKIAVDPVKKEKKNDLKIEKRANTEKPLIEHLPATESARSQMQRLPLIKSDSSPRLPVSPY